MGSVRINQKEEPVSEMWLYLVAGCGEIRVAIITLPGHPEPLHPYSISRQIVQPYIHKDREFLLGLYYVSTILMQFF